MLEKLIKIVEKAIVEDNIDKLRYIGQSLDIMLFEKKYKDYFPLFRQIDNYFQDHDLNLLQKLNIVNYPDLDELGLIRCATFN